jgi:Glycerophosphoryl diester phosphodiesterase family
MRLTLLIFIVHLQAVCHAQTVVPHVNAHAHNDYEHTRPLFDAMMNGFTSVEADVHLREGKLFVSHNQPGRNAKVLEVLYLNPLDSLLKVNQGHIYLNSTTPFYLMIDCKTEAASTFQAIKDLLAKYLSLNCLSEDCGVKIFLSGNRPVIAMIKEGYSGIGIDGRPDDLGKGYTSEQMPVISDNYKNWSSWNGKSILSEKDLLGVKELAKRVHDEGKKFRLWAIPDNEIAWSALLEAGVDFINTDRLSELNLFLNSKGL